MYGRKPSLKPSTALSYSISANSSSRSWLINQEREELLAEIEYDRAVLGLSDGLRPYTWELIRHGMYSNLKLPGSVSKFPQTGEGMDELMAATIGQDPMFGNVKLPKGKFGGWESATNFERLGMWGNYLQFSVRPLLSGTGVTQKQMTEALDIEISYIEEMREGATDLTGEDYIHLLDSSAGRNQAFWGVRGLELGDDYDAIRKPKEKALALITAGLESARAIRGKRSQLPINRPAKQP